MRILMTTDTVGGVWTYTRELAAGLLDEDASTSLLLVTFGGTHSNEQAEWLQRMRAAYGKRFAFEATTLPLEWQPENQKAYVYAEPLLRRLAKSFGAEVFHTNQFCFGALPVACPKVVVAHSDVLSWARAVRGDAGLPESEWLKTYVELVSAGLQGASVVVAPSAAMLSDLRNGFDVQTALRVIANGRDVRPLRIAKKLQAVTAGRVWDEAKGMAVLEDLFSPVPILIAGETTSASATYDAERLRRRVLLGRLSEAATLELFAESAIYLVTSLYEPFGLSAIEAAQCGCAIVARDIPSQREVWSDAATYFKSADDLKAALEHLAANDEILHQAQGKALVRARGMYSREMMTRSYLTLYRELLSTHV